MQTRVGIRVWWWVMDQSILASLWNNVEKAMEGLAWWRESDVSYSAWFEYIVKRAVNSSITVGNDNNDNLGLPGSTSTDNRQQTRPLSKFLTSLVLNHSSQILLNSFASTTRTRIAIRLQIRTKGVWEGRKNRLVVHIVFLISLKRNIAVFSRSLTSNVQY